MGTAYIGTSGFYYSNWIGDFYPKQISKTDLLTYYQKIFGTVEINSTFYHIPRAKTIENWKSKVDNKFRFCFKASRTITHLKKFSVNQDLVDQVFSPLTPFASKKARHIVLFQTPANLHVHLDKLELLFQYLPKTFLYAFEFRHDSWFSDEIYSFLKVKNAAVVLSDSPVKQEGERIWPYYNIDTANFAYIRFHGSQRLYYSSYLDNELKHYADIIKQKLSKGMDIYAYFNNDAGGYATKNALKLIELLK